MIKAFKDPFKVNLILTALFFAGIAASAFVLFRLPAALMIPYGFESYFTTVYVVIALTFLVGVAIISRSMKYKPELVVFRERTNEMIQADLDAAAEKNTITIEGVKASLSTAKDEKDIFQKGIESICKELAAGQGAAYAIKQEAASKYAELCAGFALSVNENSLPRYNFGEGLIGQAAAAGQELYLDEIPEGYIKIISGLGSASPRYLLIVPVKNQHSVLGILEIASFSTVTADQRKFVEQSAQLMAEKLFTK